MTELSIAHCVPGDSGWQAFDLAAQSAGYESGVDAANRNGWWGVDTHVAIGWLHSMEKANRLRDDAIRNAARELYDAARVAKAFLQDNYHGLVDGVPMYATMPEWIEIQAAIAKAEGRAEQCAPTEA